MPKQALEELARELELIEHIGDGGNPDPIKIRLMIRSVFAAVESLAAAMMAAALPKIAALAVSSNECSEERHRMFFEVCALSDMSYQISDRGEISIQPARSQLKNKVLFAINMLAKSNSVTIAPRKIEGWDAFLNAIRIRNRITHPQAAEDLSVSSTDYETATKGLQWVVRCNHRACGGITY